MGDRYWLAILGVTGGNKMCLTHCITSSYLRCVLERWSMRDRYGNGKQTGLTPTTACSPD